MLYKQIALGGPLLILKIVVDVFSTVSSVKASQTASRAFDNSAASTCTDRLTYWWGSPVWPNMQEHTG